MLFNLKNLILQKFNFILNTRLPAQDKKWPGPSAQNNGIRHVLLMSVLLGKGFILGDFDKHFTDDLSKISQIPLGVRMDLQDLCNFVTIKDDKYLLSDYRKNRD